MQVMTDAQDALLLTLYVVWAASKAVCDATENGSGRVVCEWGSGSTGKGQAVSLTHRACKRDQMTRHLDDYPILQK